MRLPRKSKYKAIPTVVDGRRFASKKEAKRYGWLRCLEKAGHIANLECQVPYQIDVNGVKICRWIADFRYLDLKTGQVVVEDAKGFKTPVYKLKAKLMLAVHGIVINEV